jgi:hypothetical protein
MLLRCSLDYYSHYEPIKEHGESTDKKAKITINEKKANKTLK